MNKRKRLICCILLIFLTSCAQPKLVEKLGFVHSIAFDLNEDRENEDEHILIQTIEMPQISETATSDREVLTVTANTSKEGMMKIAKKSDRQIVNGQLRTVLLGDSIAKIGIADTMDTLIRDHEIGLNVMVITVKGSAKELLESDYPEHPRTSRFIFEMVQNDSKMQSTIDTTIHQFIRDYYDDGIDPITALIKKADQDIDVEGIALYKDDKFVDHISINDTRVFMMLHSNYVGGDLTFEIDLPKEKKENYTYITFNTLESKRKITVDNEKSPRTVHIDLKVSGTIDEYTGTHPLTDDEIQRQIEKKVEEHIKVVAENLLKRMQEKKIDNIGIGQYVRNSLSYEEWKKLNWREELANVKFDITVKVDVKNFGMAK